MINHLKKSEARLVLLTDALLELTNPEFAVLSVQNVREHEINLARNIGTKLGLI